MTEQTGDWPEGVLFRPTWDVPWQYDYIARMAVMGDAILAADMGLGKSVMALGLAGVLLENDLIDGVLVVCEKNKRKEWLEDFGRFTRIPAAVYWGPKRKDLLDVLPTAVITTYETCRSDVATFPPKGSRARKLAPGPLFKPLAGRRMLVIYDEVTKLGRRTSALYKAHYWMVAQLRKGRGARVIGMSGTPMDTSIENLFNEARIVTTAMPPVGVFEDNASSGRDPFGNLTFGEKGREWLRPFTDPWILRKRKSDPDVRDTFPPLTEQARSIAMHPDQYRLYCQLEDLAWDKETQEHIDVPGLEVLLRQLAGDPLAVLAAGEKGNSELAVMVCEELGTELARCSSAKAEELIELADTVLAAGGKLLVFSFFTTVLSALRKRLGDRPVFMYIGDQTDADREHQKAVFKAMDGGAIMLASDAGARGINLPEISYVVEYEVARTHSLRQQRANRGHRMGRTDPLTLITFVLESSLEGTRSIGTLLSRNRDQDYILRDDEAEGHVTAADRRTMFAQARKRKGA
jgi:SNF2 family DNA or RNA helicase